jgi:hypothetical protein
LVSAQDPNTAVVAGGRKGKDDRKQSTLARLGDSVTGQKTTKDFVLFSELDVVFCPE